VITPFRHTLSFQVEKVLAEVLGVALVLQEESPCQGINGLLLRQSWSMLLQELTPQLTARRTTLNFLKIYVQVAKAMDASFVFPPNHPMHQYLTTV
jgi:hypothetical protein